MTIIKSCDTCKFHSSGVVAGYPWQECFKNWSEKSKPFIGVFKHMCSNYQPPFNKNNKEVKNDV